MFCYLRFASGKIAHMHLSWLDPHKMRRLTVVGRDKMAVFDDMELEHKITVYDKAPEQPSETYGEWRTRTGDTFSPKLSNAEPLRLECAGLPRARGKEGWDGREDPARRPEGRARARAPDRESSTWRSEHPRSHETAIVYPGTKLGDGVKDAPSTRSSASSRRCRRARLRNESRSRPPRSAKGRSSPPAPSSSPGRRSARA